MRRIVSGSLTAILVALSAIPVPAMAATKSAPDEEEDVVIIDDIEGESPPAEGETPAPTGDIEADLFGTEATGEADAQVPEDAEIGKQDKDSEERQIKADQGLITVVQRQRMLKKRRFELQPQVGITINDPYVRHTTLGLDLNYWITNRIAVGLTGTGFIGNRTARYDNIRFQEGLLLTANQVLWQASVNFSFNFIYGKIAIFNRALLHWEASFVVGGGPMQTRVIPRFEALHQPFTSFTGGGHIGIMGRFYVPRVNWLSVNWGIRAWGYPDFLEPSARGPFTNANEGETDIAAYDDPATAKKNADRVFGVNVTAFLGVSFYFPTSFEYTTPR